MKKGYGSISLIPVKKGDGSEKRGRFESAGES